MERTEESWERKSTEGDIIDINVWYGHFKSILGYTANETVDESNVQDHDVIEKICIIIIMLYQKK